VAKIKSTIKNMVVYIRLVSILFGPAPDLQGAKIVIAKVEVVGK
jgi:hypothetical protein